MKASEFAKGGIIEAPTDERGDIPPFRSDCQLVAKVDVARARALLERINRGELAPGTSAPAAEESR